VIKEAIILLIGCIVLVKSASYSVRSVAHIARYFKLTEFVTSFILVAIVAALPDAFIAITASLTGNSSLGVGALIGGNIADLTLILGLVALAGQPIKINSSIIQKDFYFAGLAMLPIALGLIGGKLSRIDGFILLCSGIIFFIVLLKEKRYFHKPYQDNNHVLKHAGIFLISIVFMLISSHFIVQSASSIAVTLAIPAIIFGAILLGLGTTLPELSFSIQSVKKGHPDLAVGDILGNVIIDSCIILGIISLINPIILNLTIWTIIGVFVISSVIFALIFMKTDKILTRKEATILVLFYLLFVVVQMMIR